MYKEDYKKKTQTCNCLINICFFVLDSPSVNCRGSPLWLSACQMSSLTPGRWSEPRIRKKRSREGFSQWVRYIDDHWLPKWPNQWIKSELFTDFTWDKETSKSLLSLRQCFNYVFYDSRSQFPCLQRRHEERLQSSHSNPKKGKLPLLWECALKRPLTH